MTQSYPRINVAIAAFNRKETTLSCLKSLQEQIGRGDDFELSIFLLDDASTDGTADAVRSQFPDVTILNGTGDLFWGGGMHAAMSRALNVPSDFVLLLNDDVKLRPNAMQSALNTYTTLAEQRGAKIAVIGATVAPGTKQITYSGFQRTSKTNPSKIERISTYSDTAMRCDTMNGNFVLLPKSVTDELGPVDNSFIHQLGDIDYGYRLNKSGGETWIAPNDIGECEANTRKMPFESKELTLSQKWAKLNSPLGLPVSSWATFMYRHGGTFGLLLLAALYIKKMAR
jgi:GT2 family glycosyltransferase